MANEKRLIDANAIPWEEHYVPDGDVQWEYKKELCVCKPAIDAMPTVDAVEVVHGRWEKVTGGMVKLGDCSECKVRQPVLGTNYCKNCGADMRERKDNGTV